MTFDYRLRGKYSRKKSFKRFIIENKKVMIKMSRTPRSGRPFVCTGWGWPPPPPLIGKPCSLSSLDRTLTPLTYPCTFQNTVVEILNSHWLNMTSHESPYINIIIFDDNVPNSNKQFPLDFWHNWPSDKVSTIASLYPWHWLSNEKLLNVNRMQRW